MLFLKISNEQVSPHCIFKHFEAGHTRHAWRIRTNRNVRKVFSTLWNTENLVVSYDGCCWIPKGTRKKDSTWTHSDQASSKKGLSCYQGFVALTDNETRTLVVYRGSHKLHRQYCVDRKLLKGSKVLLLCLFLRSSFAVHAHTRTHTHTHRKLLLTDMVS